MKLEAICRKHGISNATYYSWRAKYDGMGTSEPKHMHELEEENSKLKKYLLTSALKIVQ